MLITGSILDDRKNYCFRYDHNNVDVFFKCLYFSDTLKFETTWSLEFSYDNLCMNKIAHNVDNLELGDTVVGLFV